MVKALIITALFIIFELTLVSTQSEHGLSQQEAWMEQTDISCNLKDNRTLTKSFIDSVRSKHGITRSPVRGFATNQNGSPSHKCFSQLDCENTDFVFCFNLYHPTEYIEICWDSQSNIINMTEYAAFLGLDQYFHVGQNCRGIDGPCIVILGVPFYFDSGLLVCTSQNETCLAKAISTIRVERNDQRSPIELSYHNTTNELVIGQQNIYYFSALVHNNNGYFSRVNFDINGTTIQSIPESPFCDQVGCRTDQRAGAQFDYLKQNRIRVYSYPELHTNCPSDVFVFPTWLVIDDAQESDANLTILLKASFELTSFFFPKIFKDQIQLNLTAVPPLIDILTFEAPFNESVNNNSLGLILGDSTQWTVSAQGGIGDRLAWTLNGRELPLVTDSNEKEDTLCSKYNGSYYMHESQHVNQFVRNYTATLFLCNVSTAHNGQYMCSMMRSRGDERQVQLWSAQIQFFTSIATEPYIALTTYPYTEGSSIRPVVVTYITVAVFISALLITVTVTLVLVIVCIRATRRNRRFKGGRSIRRIRSDLVVQSFNNRLEMTAAWNYADFSENPTLIDELEFSRERLNVMDKVLGKGTFGLVLLAKAEGIVRDTPERNMVAVKTHKASAPQQEVDNLWEELQIMRKIKPHPHINNLLGYCRETPSSPLYLIVEFAMYGSLQTFLKECEEAVLCLNHIPHIAHKSCRSQSGSDSPTCMSPPVKPSQETTTSNRSMTLSHASNSAASFEITEAAASAVAKTYKQGDEFLCNDSSTVVGSLAQAVCDTPSSQVTHDYINSKGLLYMEDVQSFALQIASGLKHLEKEKIVHCDMAARNILISEGFVLKIGDFGMARDMSEKEYYRKSEGRIPVKWTAPEALEEHVFTHKSDIWSFGVILWEIFSYGKRPYSDVKIGQSWEPFIQSLLNGKKLPQPNGCPDIYYSLMQQCWNISPEDRPSASDLVTSLSTYTGVECPCSLCCLDKCTVVMEELPAGHVSTQPAGRVSDNEDEVSIKLEENEASGSNVTEESAGYCNTTQLGTALQPEGAQCQRGVVAIDIPQSEGAYQSLADAEIASGSSHVSSV